MKIKLLATFLFTISISPVILTQSFDDFTQSLGNFFKEKPLFQKYANSAVNYSSLVERQGLKYQVNSNTPFSGNFIMYMDDNIFCVEEAGSYRNGKLHGPLEGYEGCGVAYSFKTNYKNGLENGEYQEFTEGYLSMEGNVVNDEVDGEWNGYEYGLKTWTEYNDNGNLLYYIEYSYHQNGQLAAKETFNAEEQLNGISEIYHQNGQLESKINFQNGKVVKVIESYDYNGNLLN